MPERRIAYSRITAKTIHNGENSPACTLPDRGKGDYARDGDRSRRIGQSFVRPAPWPPHGLCLKQPPAPIFLDAATRKDSYLLSLCAGKRPILKSLLHHHGHLLARDLLKEDMQPHQDSETISLFDVHQALVRRNGRGSAYERTSRESCLSLQKIMQTTHYVAFTYLVGKNRLAASCVAALPFNY